MKKTMFLVISLLLVLSSSISFAAKPATSAKEKALISQIEQLAKTYDVEVSVGENNGGTVNFNSVSELETYFKQISAQRKKEVKEFTLDIPLQTNLKEGQIYSGTITKAAATTYNGSGSNNWLSAYCSGWGPLLCFKNVSYNYTYQFVNAKPQFISVSNYNSWLSGGPFIAMSWTHLSGSATFSTVTNTKDSANISVTGYYTIGVEVAGVPLTITNNDTWNCTLTVH